MTFLQELTDFPEVSMKDAEQKDPLFIAPLVPPLVAAGFNGWSLPLRSAPPPLLWGVPL